MDANRKQHSRGFASIRGSRTLFVIVKQAPPIFLPTFVLLTVKIFAEDEEVSITKARKHERNACMPFIFRAFVLS